MRGLPEISITALNLLSERLPEREFPYRHGQKRHQSKKHRLHSSRFCRLMVSPIFALKNRRLLNLFVADEKPDIEFQGFGKRFL